MSSPHLRQRTGSLWAWKVCTLFILLCQYFTNPLSSDDINQSCAWLHLILRIGASWACKCDNIITSAVRISISAISPQLLLVVRLTDRQTDTQLHTQNVHVHTMIYKTQHTHTNPHMHTKYTHACTHRHNTQQWYYQYIIKTQLHSVICLNVNMMYRCCI